MGKKWGIFYEKSKNPQGFKSAGRHIRGWLCNATLIRPQPAPTESFCAHNTILSCTTPAVLWFPGSRHLYLRTVVPRFFRKIPTIIGNFLGGTSIFLRMREGRFLIFQGASGATAYSKARFCFCNGPPKKVTSRNFQA